MDVKREKEDPDDNLLDCSIVKEEPAIQEEASAAATLSEKPPPHHVQEVQESQKSPEFVQFVIQELTESPNKCPECGKGFATVKNLRGHMIIHTYRERKHKCHVCTKGFFSKSSLVHHMDSHATERTFHCSQCPLSFPSDFRLKRHMRCHAESQKLACERCGVICRDTINLQKHRKRHDERKFECAECGRKSQTKFELKLHIEIVHCGIKRPKPPPQKSAVEKIFPCDRCDKVFTRKDSYVKHFTRIHTGNQNIPCPYCPRRATNQFSLMNHISYHHRRNAKTAPGSNPKHPYRRKGEKKESTEPFNVKSEGILS